MSTRPTVTDTAAQPGLLGRLADLAFRRRGRVVALWIVALVASLGLSSAFAGEFTADYTAKGSDSHDAQQLLADRFPARAGETVDVVVRAEGGVADVRDRVTALRERLATTPHVRAVTDPYEEPGAISPDGRTALARLQLDVAVPADMPVEDTERLLALAQDASTAGMQVELGGQVVALAEQGHIGSEGIGLLAAAVILLLTFGSVVAAGLPILIAVFGLALSGGVIGLMAAVVDMPEWSTALAAMMGIGVGIDYVLLMVTRFREYTAAGLTPHDATVATADTAGRSVVVAGTTVVISLLGLFATGLSYMQGAALATIGAVVVVMAATLTLLPALLSYLGARIERLHVPFVGRRTTAGRGWVRWSGLVQRRPWPAAAIGVAILGVLALPLSGVHFGFPDAGNMAEGKSTRTAYDLVAEGFGPGANGPLVLAVDVRGDASALETLAAKLRDTPGVASVSEPVRNEAGDAAVLTVVPTTSPQDPATDALVNTVRDSVIPAATSGTRTVVHVGGATAIEIDTTEDTASRLPLLIGGVVGLSFLLLLVAFRSIAIAVKAAVLNLLSIGAAYGVVAYALQGGWFGRLVGVDTETPLPAFIPVLMFAILFGLSMDYEVFLVSRIRERWVQTRDNTAAVAGGLASTGRVITAAAAIMVAVFAAFVPSEDIALKLIGIGLATAILIDATVVRMLLVPATMQILGRANWWLPTWLDRRLPRLEVEGPELPPVGEPPHPAPHARPEPVTV